MWPANQEWADGEKLHTGQRISWAILALRRQKQEDLFKFEATLVYIVSARTVRTT